MCNSEHHQNSLLALTCVFIIHYVISVFIDIFFRYLARILVATTDVLTNILLFPSVPQGKRQDRNEIRPRHFHEYPFISSHIFWVRGVQIPGSSSPWQVNSVRWRLTYVGPQYGACFMSVFWSLEFWDGCHIFLRNFCTSGLSYWQYR
jgi:hypothetical protein